MPFPSRGCKTCKQRRVKCDEVHPVCNRCQKAKLVCHRVEETGGFVFLDENKYAVGRLKRPRGPNVNAGTATQIESVPGHQHATSQAPLPEAQNFAILPLLGIPLDEQALTYYSRHYVEAPEALSGIMDGHLQCALIHGCYSQPQSILSLAIFAVSHATYGRARRSPAALSTGYTKYSKALLKTNLALKDATQSTNDDVLLAVMLLSYYENSVMDKKSSTLSRGILAMASRSFAHHDGAIALLNVRRQLEQRENKSIHLDMLVRRQLLRSVLLRSMPLPPWLFDGSQYGERGFALEFDHCAARAATLRHQASTISVDATSPSKDRHVRKLHDLLAKAQALDDDLITWANSLPPEDRYNTHVVQSDIVPGPGSMIFESTVHVYATVSHAGMWNRYRATRLAVNEVILKTLSVLQASDFEMNSLKEAAKSRTTALANDLCASVPFMLGLIELQHVAGQDVALIKTPPFLKFVVKASTASFLCWPLAMAAMMSGISCEQHYYLRSRLRDVSEIVDDGVLEVIAEGSPKTSHGRANTLGPIIVPACQYSAGAQAR
ncbi:related to negative acting factor [Phialocephala subalpina]|uniref:Related to negative acting factor n=1 Tax=Phialocephala subalpina TaxID=576137 RepID=A0A1L7WPX7_9HELO|nr:related to negative acting factor [Phialocephala subalpina]